MFGLEMGWIHLDFRVESDPVLVCLVAGIGWIQFFVWLQRNRCGLRWSFLIVLVALLRDPHASLLTFFFLFPHLLSLSSPSV
jgi:hypothetical protein